MNIEGQQSQQFTSQVPGTASSFKSDKDLLHGYIYDYLVKQKLIDSAKVFFKEAEVVSNGKTTNVVLAPGGNKSTSPSSASDHGNISNESGVNESNPNGGNNTPSSTSTPRPFSNQDAARKPTMNGSNRSVSCSTLASIIY